MVGQTLIMIPLLNEERLQKLFLHLAMEMAMVVLGDEWETQQPQEEDEDIHILSSSQIA